MGRIVPIYFGHLDKHYQCYHGSHKIITITKGMNSNLNHEHQHSFHITIDIIFNQVFSPFFQVLLTTFGFKSQCITPERYLRIRMNPQPQRKSLLHVEKHSWMVRLRQNILRKITENTRRHVQRYFSWATYCELTPTHSPPSSSPLYFPHRSLIEYS
jgi:hypothetical protein